MASNVVKVQVQADSSQLQTAFGQGATAGEKFKAKMELVGKVVVAALAVKALGAVKDFVGDSVRAFSDLNESLNAVEVTYGEAADGIKKLGEESARNLGLSNAEFNSFAVSIGAFAQQIAGDGGDVVGVVDELSKRVTDFASVMNLEVADAAEKFQSGLAGESEPLRKFGIDVSAAKVEAFAFANGIAEAGDELTEAEKVTARYGTIMEQTEKVQGDFANTATDYANAQRIANAEMENAKARAGEALVPFAQLTTELKGLAAEAIGIVSTGLLDLTGKIEDVDAHIQSFSIHVGTSTDTAAAALTIVKQYGDSFEELIPRLGLSRDELEKLKNADEDWLLSMGFTQEQVEELADVVGGELASALTEEEQRARDAIAGSEDLTEATEDLIEEQEAAAEAAREQAEETMRLAEDFRTAMEGMVGVSQQSWDQITGDVEDFLTGFEKVPDETEITMEEFETNFRERAERMKTFWNGIHTLMGIEGTEALVNELIAQGPAAVGIVEEYIADPARAQTESAFIEGAEVGIAGLIGQVTGADIPPVHIPVDVSTFTMRRLPTGEVVPSRTGSRQFQHGGVVSEGFLDGNGSTRKEAVIPLENQTGIRFMAAALREAMGSNGSGVHFHGPVYGMDDFERKLQEVIVRARRKGMAI